jgi:RNA polymerase sigma factor (sigma-70 family)
MKGRLTSVLSQLRHVVARRGEGGLSDGQLLERFVRLRDEAAFEVLVWRHGPMVLGVGRRLLHNPHDAEDILQATFLSLARQAHAIRRSEAIATWLYKVAYRLALRLRLQRDKRSIKQVSVEEIAAPQRCGRDDLGLLDEELQRLPEKYRVPLVLSYLQGMTNQEIASRMNCPIGTVFTRLARGRELLRRRLVCRGVTLSVVLASSALVPGTSMAVLRVELVRSIIPVSLVFVRGAGSHAVVLAPNVVSLMEGVEKMMLASRRRFIGVTLALVTLLGSGAGLLAWRGMSPEHQLSSIPAVKGELRSETEAKDTPPADRDRPKIVQVSPADGATDVELNTEIRIRFDRPMDRTNALLSWNFRDKGGFRPRGELHYVKETHEFVLPVHLSPGQKHEVTANRQDFVPTKGTDYQRFQSRDHIAAKPYRWSFTTKKLAVKTGKQPRVSSLSPPADSEVSLLTPLEVSFDQPMQPHAYDFNFDALIGSDRLPELLGDAEYDADKHRFKLLLALPANWNGELRLVGFRDKNGVEAQPIVLNYRTQRSHVSETLRKQIEQAGREEKLKQLVESIRKARRDLRSVSEEVRSAHMAASYGQNTYWYQTIEMQGSSYQMQGEKYLGVVDDIMRIPFRVGSDGETCWFRRNNEQIALPAKEIKEKNLRLCDAFDSCNKASSERIIEDENLEYRGESVISGRRCHRVRSWAVSLSPFSSFTPIREWHIDSELLLPLRVEMMGMGLQVIDYTHSNVNQAIPDKVFRPAAEPGVKAVEAEPLNEGYTLCFLSVNDGSSGRMSIRWGMKGPKGQSSSGLN